MLEKSPLEMFYRWEKETPDQVYLRQPKNLQWTQYTWAQVADQVRRIATTSSLNRCAVLDAVMESDFR